MSTLATLLEALAAARRHGVDFDVAWEAASVEALGSSCDPGNWAPVLDATRDSWAAAYLRLPASSHERALSTALRRSVHRQRRRAADVHELGIPAEQAALPCSSAPV